MAHHGWCSNKQCPCWTLANKTPCGQYYVAWDEELNLEHCAQCGFEKHDHK